MVFLIKSYEKVNCEKNQQTKKHETLPSMLRVTSTNLNVILNELSWELNTLQFTNIIVD